MPTRPIVARRRRLLFGTVTLALGFVALEFGAFALLRWSTGAPLTELGARRAALSAPLDEVAEQERNPWLVPHPYLGYVASPDHGLSEERAARARPWTHGLRNPEGPIVTRKPGRLVVAVLGGSVAHDFLTVGGDAFVAELQRTPGFEHLTFEFVNFALPGYKQPQQLLALAYARGLGADFDLVLNLDGFNEVALPVTHNLPYRFNPFFPRGWNVIALSRADPTVLRFAGLAHVRRIERRELAITFSGAPWCWSNTALLAWTILDRRSESRIADAQRELSMFSAASTEDFAVTGPRFDYEDDADLMQRLVLVWSECSRRIHELCAASGSMYVHCLQPNQFVEGTKPLSDWELEHAAPPDNPFRDPVARGYPLLRSAGAELARHGVDFLDLTRIFETHEATLYVDSCCHLNEQGNAILAVEIARHVAARGPELLEQTHAVVGLPPTALVGPADRVELSVPHELRAIDVFAEYEDGTRSRVDASATWRAADPEIIAVTRSGWVRGLRPGATTVSVQVGAASVEVAVVVSFSSLVTFGDGAPIDAELSPDGSRLRFTVRNVAEDVIATLHASPETVRSPWCGRFAYVPLERALAWPLGPGTHGVHRVGTDLVVELDIPDACRGRTTFWQCMFQHPNAPCGWTLTRGVALTL